MDDTTRINDRPTTINVAAEKGSGRRSLVASGVGGSEGFFGIGNTMRLGLERPFGTAEEEKLGRRFVGFEPFR